MLMQVSAGRGRGPEVVGFYDPSTSSIQYLASDPTTGRCAVIDPVLDYDAVTGSTPTGSADALLDVVRERGFEIAWIFDTHPPRRPPHGRALPQGTDRPPDGHRCQRG